MNAPHGPDTGTNPIPAAVPTATAAPRGTVTAATATVRPASGCSTSPTSANPTRAAAPLRHRTTNPITRAGATYRLDAIGVGGRRSPTALGDLSSANRR